MIDYLFRSAPPFYTAKACFEFMITWVDLKRGSWRSAYVLCSHWSGAVWCDLGLIWFYFHIRGLAWHCVAQHRCLYVQVQDFRISFWITWTLSQFIIVMAWKYRNIQKYLAVCLSVCLSVYWSGCLIWCITFILGDVYNIWYGVLMYYACLA